MFTDKHQTPWGAAINLDDTHSDGVRHFFIDNAIHWLREYHFDGLRLDATHALKDDSETHFLAELRDRVDAEVDGPRRYLIAEDPRNISTFVQPRAEGGYGMDGVWTDDLHHQIRHMTAGDTHQYYANYAGHRAPELATTIRDGWFYQGQADQIAGEPFGTDPSPVSLDQCVVCIQNHDQVGNRPHGDRLTDNVPLSVYRAASALLLFVPETPLLFMGQEWAASTPFLFFTDHNDELGEQVRAGRAEEFEQIDATAGSIPDPQAQDTFERSKLIWGERDASAHARTLALYRDFLSLRRDVSGDPEITVHSDYALTVRRGDHVLLVALADDETIPLPDGTEVLMHTELKKYAPDPVTPFVDNGTLETATAGAPIHFPRAAALVAAARNEA
jgi:maltooligosyltrehalose trehalohydrolase